MHPGPMNRGVEIAPEVAALPRSVITKQVANGVAVRMAVLFNSWLGSGRGRRRLSWGAASSGRRRRRFGVTLVIRGGDVVDAAGRRRADVLVADGHVVAVGPDLTGDVVLDAGGLRRGARPGRPPHPPAPARPGGGRDGRDRVARRRPRRLHRGRGHAQHRARHRLRRRRCARCTTSARGALCDVEVAGAITVGRDGERLAPMAEMAALGVRLFTDDGTGVQDDRLMRRALEYAGGLGVTLAQHCEDSALAGGGHMHEGEWSSRLGIPGQPAEAEELMVHARHRAGPAHRRPRPLPAPVDGGQRGHGARRHARRPAGHRRGDARTTSPSPTSAAPPTTRCSR